MLNVFGEHLLSWITFSPLIVAALLAVIPNEKVSRWVALGGSLAIFVLTLGLLAQFDGTKAGYQFVVSRTWLSAIGVKYSLGVDGISLYLVLLTAFFTPVVIAASWHSVHEGVRRYFFFLLALESVVIGGFLALDLFLFYVFWEAMLIPMFFLIGVWGGKERVYAAQKFLLYTFAGSVPMLVAIIYLVLQTKVQFGAYSADLNDVLKLSLPAGGMLSPQGLVFLAFALAFAVKVPMFPLHTWSPVAYVQAPTGAVVMLAAVMAKMGSYGLLRFAMPLGVSILPIVSPWMMGLAAIAIAYGACLAIVQDDVKKLIAYSSLSHMGYIVLGMFSLNVIGITGSLYQMLNHGISTGALFLLAGILYERRQSREIKSFSGLAKTIPLFSIAMIAVAFSSVALPGSNGFVGEFLILQGSFLSAPWFTLLAGTGVILGAVYVLWMVQRVLFGAPDTDKHHHLHDLHPREFAYLAPLLFLIVFMGLYPKAFFKNMEPTLAEYTKRLSVTAPVAVPGLPVDAAPAAPAEPTEEGKADDAANH